MLLDTSGLICLLNRAQQFHTLAKQHFDQSTLRITHSLILAELVPLADKRTIPRSATLAFVKGLLSGKELEIVWVDKALIARALILLEQRLDKDYSLCDASSMIVMRERGLTEALSTDYHFEQEGFRRLLV